MTDRYEQIAKSHWRQFESDSEHEERVEAARNEALWFFDQATKDQLATYRETMAEIAAYKGAPMWDRKKAEADRIWKETTAAARELFLQTLDDLMRCGELGEATIEAWDGLDLPAVSEVSSPAKSLEVA